MNLLSPEEWQVRFLLWLCFPLSRFSCSPREILAHQTRCIFSLQSLRTVPVLTGSDNCHPTSKLPFSLLGLLSGLQALGGDRLSFRTLMYTIWHILSALDEGEEFLCYYTLGQETK